MYSTTRFGRLLSVAAVAVFVAACAGGGPQGDAARGETLYEQCAGCHLLQENMAGPKHCNLLGRAAGSVPDFEYSDAMLSSGLTWDAKTLDEFLTSPISYVNGTKMGFAGFDDPTDRADLIAYIQQVSHDP